MYILETQVLWGVFLMSSRDMEVDGVSTRRTSTNVTSDSYLPLDDGEVELSDDVRRRGLARRNTAGEFVSEAGETFRDAIRRPISILVEPELLNVREGYFDVKEDKQVEEKDDVESKENESKEEVEVTNPRSNPRRRRRTERKVMGFLPVFLNPDLDESGTALGFGLGFEDFGEPFSLRNRIRRRENYPTLVRSESSDNRTGQRARRRVQTISIETLNRSLIQDEDKVKEEELLVESSNGMVPLDVDGDSVGLLRSLEATTSTAGSLADVTLSEVSSSDSLSSKPRSKSFAL